MSLALGACSTSTPDASSDPDAGADATATDVATGDAPGDGAQLDGPAANDGAVDAVLEPDGPERFFAVLMGPSEPARPEACDASGGCSPGKICFRLAAELAVCDLAQPVESNQCTVNPLPSGTPDMCGCDGLTCGAGQICTNVVLTCSCTERYNVCVDTACTSAADCADSSVCTPSSYILPYGGVFGGPAQERCLVPGCRADADCVSGPNGRCALVLTTAVQRGQDRLLGVACVYTGPAPAGCNAQGVAPLAAPSGVSYYRCTP